MNELISKDEVMRRFKPFGREIPKDQVMAVLARIDEGIVRCRRCKHYGDSWCGLHGTPMMGEDFCNYGERSDK